MRVKRGQALRKKHKKVLKATKGYVGSKSKLFRSANQTLMKAGRYSYNDRRKKKGDFRSLWVVRINAACRENGTTYSRLISALNKANIIINRKILAELAVKDKEAFQLVISTAKAA